MRARITMTSHRCSGRSSVKATSLVDSSGLCFSRYLDRTYRGYDYRLGTLIGGVTDRSGVISRAARVAIVATFRGSLRLDRAKLRDKQEVVKFAAGNCFCPFASLMPICSDRQYCFSHSTILWIRSPTLAPVVSTRVREGLRESPTKPLDLVFVMLIFGSR